MDDFNYETLKQEHEEQKAQLLVRNTGNVYITPLKKPRTPSQRKSPTSPKTAGSSPITTHATEIPIKKSEHLQIDEIKKLNATNAQETVGVLPTAAQVTVIPQDQMQKNPMHDKPKIKTTKDKDVEAPFELSNIYQEASKPTEINHFESPIVYSAIPTALLLHSPLLCLSYVNLIRIYCCVASIDALLDRSPENQSYHILSILILLGCVLSFALPLHLQIYALIGADLLITTYTVPKVHAFFQQKPASLPDEEIIFSSSSSGKNLATS